MVLPLATKKLQRFRQDTKRLEQEKTAHGHWNGFHYKLPPLRRRPGNADTSLIVGKNLPTPKPQRGDSLRTKARRLLRMGRKDVEPVVIDLLEDTDEVTLQDFAAEIPQTSRQGTRKSNGPESPDK